MPALPIRIRYHRWWGPIFLVLAAANGVIFALTGATMQLAFGALLLVVGVLYAVQPFLVVTDGSIHARNLLGITIRRFAYRSLAELEVVPGGIVIVDLYGQRQRLKLSGWMVARGDLARLAAAIDEARAARPPAAEAPASAGDAAGA